jgi:hypothetical protein
MEQCVVRAILAHAAVHEPVNAAHAAVTSRSVLRESAAYNLGKDDCVIVVPISGRIDESECALTCAASELLEPRPFVTKLVEVAAPEFLKATRVVSEPPS